MAARDSVTLELDGRAVRFSNPDKPFFAEGGITKLDLCRYHLDVADAIIPHLRDRPTSMKRFRTAPARTSSSRSASRRPRRTGSSR
jgi:DNA primase